MTKKKQIRQDFRYIDNILHIPIFIKKHKPQIFGINNKIMEGTFRGDIIGLSKNLSINQRGKIVKTT